MKSYDQVCAVARALDVIGDRWTLLIVRELLIRGAARFGELQRGLPGVAPNLLTSRLRDLESHGVLTRSDDDGPPRYELTPRGRELQGVVRELLKWGAPLAATTSDDAVFQMHWFSMPAAALLRDGRPEAAPQRIRFGTVDDGFDAVAADGSIAVTPPDPTALPDAVVTGPARPLIGLVRAAIPLEAALGMGVAIDGDADAVRRVLPGAAA